MSKISVIIPVYNAEKYMRKSLDSLLNQTFKDLEIICINDGSTDSSLDILKEYASKDTRIKIIDKPNSGYGASVNLGIEKAQSDFVAIFEPDDILDKNIYEVLYKKATETNLPVVKCNFYNMWETKKETLTHILKPMAPSIRDTMTAKEAGNLVYEWLKSVGVPNKLKDEGFSESDIERLVELAFTTPSLDGLLSIAPTEATKEAVRAIYEKSL